jgi:hypothetical protein
MRLISARCGPEIAAAVVPAEILELILEAIDALEERAEALGEAVCGFDVSGVTAVLEAR